MRAVGAATLLPAVIYFASVVLFIATRRRPPATGGFSVGRWETPVVVRGRSGMALPSMRSIDAELDRTAQKAPVR